MGSGLSGGGGDTNEEVGGNKDVASYSPLVRQEMVAVATLLQIKDAISESQNAFFSSLPPTEAKIDANLQLQDILTTVSKYKGPEEKQKLLAEIGPLLFSVDELYTRLYQILKESGVTLDSGTLLEVEIANAKMAVTHANKLVTVAQAAAAGALTAANTAKAAQTPEALYAAEKKRIEAENAKAISDKASKEAKYQVDAADALLKGDMATYNKSKGDLKKSQEVPVVLKKVPLFTPPVTEKDTTPWGMIAGGAFVLWLLSTMPKDKQ